MKKELADQQALFLYPLAMNVTSTARAELGLSVEEFASWLSEESGKDIDPSFIERLESESRSPSKELRLILAPIAARSPLKEIKKGLLSDAEAVQLIVSSQR